MDLPEEPEKPLQSDCCGLGCTPCVFDIYERELQSWREKCEEIKSGSLGGETLDKNFTDGISHLMCKEKFNKFILESIEKVTECSSLYRFKLSRNQEPKFDIGQHLILRSKLTGRKITRSYTIVSPPDAKGYFEVMIKLYENGLMSKYIESWKIGTSVEWMGPFGGFFYTPNQYTHVTMLTAGTGFAPMLQIIKAILDNEVDETQVLLVCSYRKASDILMRERLDEFKDFWNFKVVFCLTSTNAETDNHNRYLKYGDVVFKRRIDEELLINELPTTSVSNCLILICGTKSFDECMMTYIKNIGYSNRNIFVF
eukprot:gene8162-9035_t